MDEMQIDVEDSGGVGGFGAHQVIVPDFVEQVAGRHALEAPERPILARLDPP